MKDKFNKSIGNSNFGPRLQVSKNITINDLQFVEYFGVTDLQLNNCQNAYILRAPVNLRRLSISNTPLKTIKGIERLTQLQYLVLKNCQIFNIDRLLALDNLEVLDVSYNKIDREYNRIIRQLENNGCQIICENYQINYEQIQNITQNEINESDLW
ncbi:Conserved_hypothetical protein [Hexamita inflata]|uniref:Leucine rich repeat protein n=1 Tax=Hexamita inflata TaxID=28002 RepID=A0AA86RH68_9EUKA|nr:Conserved hypothetical protein [Hexamita inflata]